MPNSARFILCALWLVATAAPAWSAPHSAASLEILDDLGEPLSHDVEICWYLGLDTRCENVGTDQVVAIPPDFDSVRIEGARHGPLTQKRRELPAPGAGSRSLRIARKAQLIVAQAETEVTLSVYPSNHPSFRKPTLRRPLGPGTKEPIWIAARPSVVSLSARGRAPDLHLIDPAPGQAVSVAYGQRPGWSLLVRVHARATGETVPNTSLTLTGLAGYPMRDPAEIETRTNTQGLAVVSGLETPVVEASLKAEGFVPERVVGWTASPSSFAFEEVRLGRGGKVEILVSVDGEPLVGAVCSLRAPFTPTHQDEVEARPPIDLGTTDPKGRCGRTGLHPGPYDLVVDPASDLGGLHIEQIVIVDEETASQRLDLHPMVVEGRVLRGDRPEEGYRVEARRHEQPPGRNHRVTGRAETDSEGRYSLVLWEEATYLLALFDPRGTPTDFAWETVSANGLEHDFLLAEHEIVGLVTDDEGEPISEVSVGLRWPREATMVSRAGRTDEAGRFRFSVDDKSGPAQVTAGLLGYGRDSAEIEVVRGERPPPIHLELKKRPGLRGQVIGATGTPLPNIEIHAAHEVTGEPSRIVARARSQQDGSFFLSTTVEPSTHFFTSGPGCPLAVHALRPDTSAEHTLPCPALPANIRLHLHDEDGQPVPGVSVFLRHGPTVIPIGALAGHLRSLGLPTASDGSGRLPLVALAPGTYDLYKADETSEGAILAGYPGGFLASVRVGALDTREVQVTLNPR